MRTILEEQQSPGGGWKVSICLRDGGRFEVLLLRWVEEVVPEYGDVATFWSQVDTTGSTADSIESARQVARDLLHLHARDEYQPARKPALVS